MNVRRSLLALSALALPALACQLIVGIDDHDFRLPVEVEAEAAGEPIDAGADVPEPVLERCANGVVPPARPLIADGNDEPRLVFAMRHATLRGRDADGGVVGFDVDGVCTCDDRDHSRHGGGVSCTPASSPLRTGSCDEDGGIDNAIAYAFDVFANVPGFSASDDAIDTQIRCGRQTLLYTLQNYNGQANDPDVVISAVESIGVHAPHADGAELDGTACGVDDVAIDGGAPYPARFDGTDVWSPSSATPAEVVTGWVRDFRLVLDGRAGSAGDVSVLPLLFGSRIVTIGTPLLVARLVPLDENGQVLAVDGAGRIQSPDGKARSFRLEDGLLSGRASASDVLAASGSVRLTGTPEGDTDLCLLPGPYCLLKSVVCSGVDTMKLSNRDFEGAPCDALSLVLQFDAVTAQLGAAMAPLPRVDTGCADWTDACNGGKPICP